MRNRDPEFAAHLKKMQLREQMAHYERTVKPKAAERGRLTIYACIVPGTGIGNVPEQRRFHVFECDPQHEVGDQSRGPSEAVSFADRPDGFTDDQEALQWVFHRLKGRVVFGMPGMKAAPVTMVGG